MVPNAVCGLKNTTVDAREVLEIIRSHLDALPLVLYIHGSRAYGYAYTGSDFDIRGIFIELNRKRYFSPFWPARIETHIDEHPYDIRLWELRKFSKLVLGFNPIVYELLQLEPFYICERFRGQCIRLINLARNIYLRHPPNKLYHHYYGLFKSWLRYLEKAPEKSIYHIIRSFLALSYISTYKKPPPSLEFSTSTYPVIFPVGGPEGEIYIGPLE
mgnify:CR=1 FL=1